MVERLEEKVEWGIWSARLSSVEGPLAKVHHLIREALYISTAEEALPAFL